MLPILARPGHIGFGGGGGDSVGGGGGGAAATGGLCFYMCLYEIGRAHV